jgi:NTE family protein
MQTMDIMTIDRIKENEAMADLVIYPDMSEFGMLDSSGYEDIFQSGIRAADEHVERLIALSAGAPVPPAERIFPVSARNVRNVRIEGLHSSITADLEKGFSGWTSKPYDVNVVNSERERIAALDDVASVDVDTFFPDDDSSAVDVLFSVEKRPAFELGVEGYTASFHSHRWISLYLNARDLSRDGDSANLNLRLGNNEWGADARYFTPLKNWGQWGFALSASRDDYELYGFDPYTVERYSTRVMYYREGVSGGRIGFGLAGEYVNAPGHDKFVWGPYLYFDRDTFDNVLTPSRGYSVNARLWLNDDALVSRTTLTAYVPFMANLRFLLNFGLETGKRDNAAYRAILGDSEELISLANHPLAGDQAFWARIGMGRDFYSSWWGAIRGEVFAAYGAAMENWGMECDMWETGVALSLPGQLLNGRLVLVYNSNDEFVFGFSLGNPRWSFSPLP